MADPKPRTALRIESLAAALEQPLENEAAILDVLVAALARGQAHEELWEQLHVAAQRDDRLAELAFAYERLARDKKVKGLPPAAQATVLAHAGVFSADVFGDTDGAEGYLERALSAAPGDIVAFERYEQILTARRDLRRLGELYAAAAPHRGERAEQLRLLRRGAELVDDDAERALKLHLEILRLDPADATSKKALEDLYQRSGRIADLAKLLEQALVQEPALPKADAHAVRARLLGLYAGGLGDIERALPHVEEILRVEAAHEQARRVGEELLAHKPLTARAASALAAAYEAAEEPSEAARMIGIEIEALRGPKRLEAQKKLARITLEQLGDLDKTFPMFEAIVPLDPADDEVRARFVQLASAIDKQLEATRTLTRAATGTRDAALRARINADLGDLFRELADAKKARASYQAVLDAHADDDASVRAARALAALSAEPRDPKALAAALARLVEIEPQEDARVAATAELASVAENELADLPTAIAAYEKLQGTKLAADANRALARLYEATGKMAPLADVLERMVAGEPDRAKARDLAFRAAEIRSTQLSDRGAALLAWQGYIAAHGPTREALARLSPLLEQEKRWDELASALTEEARLSPKAEQAPPLARLGQLLLTRKGDAAGALDAFRRALAADPSDKQSRTAVERMLTSGDLRLAAADLLEPLARADASAALLGKVLETRASLAMDASARLAALAEAADLCQSTLRDPKRALDLSVRGLGEAVNAAVDEVPAWVERVGKLTAGGDATRRATALRDALGERVIDHPAIATLARNAGEALVQCGDVAGALAVYRRALAFEPSSHELLEKIDTLLREQGSPEERLSLYRTALAQAADGTRRRELLHAIGAIQRRDLGDSEAALTTYKEALAESADDRVALGAVLEIHESRGAWEELYAELVRAFDAAAGDERAALQVRLAEVAAARGWGERAAGHYAAIVAGDGIVADDLLVAAERAARERDDVTLLRAVLERRVSSAIDPDEEARWLTVLGELLRDRLDDPAASAHAFRQAAASAETAGDAAQAAGLFERVLALAPGDRTAAERLLRIYRDMGAWDRQPAVYSTLLRAAPSVADAVRIALSFEAPALRANAGARFVDEVDALLARGDEVATFRAALRSARARVLAHDPAHHADAAVAYRAILDEGDDEAGAEARAFDELLSKRGIEAVADRRWLFAYRADRAPEGERVPLLLTWAAAEEGALGDPAAAAELYRRVVALDPENDAALAARTRLLLAQGAFAEAAETMGQRRTLSHGAARTALDLELGALLLDHLGRLPEALDAAGVVLDANPADPAAIRLVERALGRTEAGGEDTEQARKRAAEMLEHAADTVDSVEAFAALMDVLLATPPGDPVLAGARRGWFVRYLDRAGLAAPRGLEVAIAAVKELPAEIPLWERAEQLARAARTPERVADAYQRALGVASTAWVAGLSPDTIEEIGRRAVDYHEEWFDQPEMVIALLRRIIALAPGSTWTFERLKLVFNLGERWEDLFALYDDAIAHTADPDARREMLEDAALAAKDLASDLARATRYYEALYALRPDPRTRVALERLYERHGRHRALIDLLATELREATLARAHDAHDAHDADAIQKLRVRIALLWLDGVGDPEAALDVIAPMIAADPQREEGYELLERVLSRAAPGQSAARRRAAALLKDRYGAAGRALDLARVLEVEVETALTPSERAERLRALARLLLDNLHDEARAFDAVAALLVLEPARAEHRTELGRLAERLGRPERLAEALASAAEAAQGSARLDLLAHAAEIYERKLGDPKRAIELHHTILRVARDADAAALTAAKNLDRLLASSPSSAPDDARRCEVLERLASLEPDPAARRAARAELSRLALAAGDAERAVRAFRAALADDPTDVRAEDGLIRALEDASRWTELVAVLEARAARAGDGEARRADRVRVAQLYEAPIGDAARAVTAWTEVRAAFGADDESTDVLARLLYQLGRLAELCALLEAEAAATTDEARAADLWFRIGEVHRARTGNLNEAVAAYDLALEQRPFHEGARRGLEALLAALDLADPDTRPTLRAAVSSLSRLYGAADDHGAAVALLEPRLAAAASDAERVAVLTETAALYERRSGDPAGAFDAILRAVELAPSDVLVARLVRLADLADRWSAVAEVMSKGLAERGDVPPALRRELLQRLAQWQRDRGDLDAAEASLTKALVLEPKSEPLLAQLAEVRRRSPGRALVETLLELAAARGGDVEVQREAVEVAEGLGDAAWTRALAQELLDAATRDPSGEGPQRAGVWAIEALARLAETDAARAALFLRGASFTVVPSERRRLRLAGARLSQADAAIALYAALFDDDPDDREASDRLEELYRGLGRRGDLIALRERQIAASSDPARGIELRLDLAALRAAEGDREGAIAALRTNLEAGFHAASMERLAELYEAGGHDAELMRVYEERAAAVEHAGDTSAAVALWEKAATFAEHELEDVKRAVAAHQRAAALGSATSDEALARLLTARGDHGAASVVLERICARLEAKPAAPAVLAEAVLRLVDSLRAAGRVAAARARLERAASGERPGAPARQRLAALYREAGEWRALAELLAEDAGKTSDGAARVALLREAAEIHLVRQADPVSAIPLLEQAARLSQDDALAVGIHLRLASARRATGDLDQAAEALRSMLAAYGARRPKERAVVHFELAQVSLAKGDRARAIAELDAALRIDPAHPEVLHSLAKLSFEDGQLERAARSYRALLSVVRRPRGEGPPGPNEVSRTEVLFELAEIARLRGEADRATEHLESAFEAARESEGERDRLLAALRSRGRLDLLARALEKRLGESPPQAEVTAIQHELASIYEHLGRPGEALDARLSALSHVERTPEALAAALDLARRAGQVERFVAALARFADVEEDEGRSIDLQVTAGRALEDDLHDDARAAAAYRKAEALAGGALVPDVALLTSLWRALAGVYERLGDKAALEALLERRIDAGAGALDAADLADASYQLAELRLARPTEAAATAEALALLDRAMSIEPRPDRAERALRAALLAGADRALVARALTDLARDTGVDATLMDALLVLAQAEAGGDALEHLHEAFEIAERLGDDARKATLLGEAVARAGAHGDAGVAWALAPLADLRASAGDLGEATSLRERAARVADADEGRALLLGVAAVAAGPLADLPRAARIYEELREREPAEAEIWQPLLEVYRRAGDRVRLAALLDETAPLLEATADRSALRLERARLALGDDHDRAVVVLTEILEDDPSATEAAEVLTELLEKLGRREELAELVRKQLDAAKDREQGPAIVQLSLRLGALLEQQWDEQGALDAYHAALAWEPKSRELLRQIVRLGMARDDSLSLGDALEALLSVEASEDAVDLALRLAKIRGDHDDEPGALEALELGWRARPGDARLREELVRRYTTGEAWDKLAAIHVADAEQQADPKERRAGLLRAATMLRERASDPGAAAEILLRALDVAPESREVLAAVIETLGATGQHARAAEAIGRAILATPGDPELYRTRASIQASLGQDMHALLDLEQAYEKSGGRFADELVDALRRAAAACAAKTNPESRVALRGLRLRLAAVLAQAGDLEGARIELNELVRADPRDRTALHALALLAETTGDWEAASAVYARLVAIEEGEGLVDTALRLADACERGDRLGDARHALERARAIAPTNADVRARLRDVYNITGAGSELAALLLDDAAQASDPVARFSALVQAGRLLIAAEGQAEAAAAVFEQARVIRQDDAECMLLLADAYTIAGRLAEARTVLDGAVTAQRGRRTRALAAVHRRLARLDVAAGDNVSALAALTRAFDNDAQNAHLAMELGTLAVELEEHEPATRAFRAVTLMKTAPGGAGEGATSALRALAYYHLGRMAFIQGDNRKARLMIDKAVADDPTLDAARALLEQLRTT